jgi:hypothetical protein
MTTKDKKMLTDHIAEILRLENENDYIEIAERLSDNFFMVRPSGNPLTKSEWLGLVNSTDMEIIHTKLVGFNLVEVNNEGTMGYVCYTTQSKFKFKGVENDDVAVFTAIFKRDKEDGWKMVFMQRSQGRKPTSPLPKFY